MNIHLLASSMNPNLELEGPIDSIFSKSTSGLEIIDPFCDPRDSENHPISYSLSAVLIEFQRSRSLSKRIFWSVLLSLSPERKSTGNRDRSRGLKIHSTEKGVLVADTEVEWIIPPGNSKSRVWHRKATRNSKLERKGQFQTKDPVSRGKLPGVQLSSPEGLCPPKAAFLLAFPCNEPKGERQGSVSRFKVTSQSNCTSERRKSRLRATRCNVSKVTESSERGIGCFAHPTTERVFGEGLSCVIADSWVNKSLDLKWNSPPWADRNWDFQGSALLSPWSKLTPEVGYSFLRGH